MENLPFVIWMVGYSFISSWIIPYSKKCGIEYDDKVRGIAAGLHVVIWIVVGAMLYKHT